MKGHKRNIFPGGNTPYGFHSYYNYIMPQNKAEKIFCLKGGPGTGKSTIMKEIGEYFIDNGEDVDFLWCSSDPDSLDGVVTVSYTHLDVYKRQAFQPCGRLQTSVCTGLSG